MSVPSSTVTCRFCGAALPLGSVKYVVSIHVIADFDGYLPHTHTVEDNSIANLLEEIEGRSEEDLNNEVYYHDNFYLCQSCRQSLQRSVSATMVDHGKQELH